MTESNVNLNPEIDAALHQPRPRSKEEIDGMPPGEREYYFEWEYPYTLPECEILDVVNAALIQNLSPLENAYVRWMLEVCNREMAVDRFIHPAYWFDKINFGSKYLKGKPEVNALIKTIRRNCPYLRLYTADYITGLLHDEIQDLRSVNRKERFYGSSADQSRFAGKKSAHDQEMEEIDRLVELIKLIHEMKKTSGGYGGTPTEQNDLDNSIDRVIAGSRELIHRRENGSGRSPEQSP